jgi:hypothetical protein
MRTVDNIVDDDDDGHHHHHDEMSRQCQDKMLHFVEYENPNIENRRFTRREPPSPELITRIFSHSG